MKKIAVIILNWNGKEDTLECLESIQNMEQGTFNLEVIVVDNGSTDDSVDRITKFIDSEKSAIKLVENQENLGFAGGNNIGIKHALENEADYVMLLNNDTQVDKNLMTELLKAMEQNKNVGIVGPKIYFAKGYEYHRHRYKETELGRIIWYAGGLIDWRNVYASHRGVDEVDIGQYDKVEETAFTTGCAMLVKKEVFGEIGFLDEKYFMYLEDVDLCLRARKAGFKILYKPQGIVWHKNAQSSGQPGSPLHTYYLTRNRLIFGMRYSSLRTKIALLRESIRLYFKSDVERWAVSDFFLGRLGKGKSYGTI